MTMPNETTDPDVAEWTGDEGEPAETDTDAAEQDDPADDAEDEDQHKKVGVRQRLKDAEDERDHLRDALAYANELSFDAIAREVGVEPELMTAAGIKGDHYPGPYGVLDVQKLKEVMEAKRVELNIPRRPVSNPMAGRVTDSGRGPATTFGDVLKEHGKGMRG